MMRIGMVMLAAALLSLSAQAGEPAPPETLEDAAPNTWVRICRGLELRRASAGMVWVPGEKAFVLFGGAMGMWKPGTAPYTEMTLKLKEARWENRFPHGKLGVWGERTGMSNAPGFPGRSYYGVYMKDKEGTARPYLGSGYDRAMYQYHNYTWDSDRKVAVVVWHWGKVTAEYDPAKRTWRIVDMGKAAPPEMWDDFLWGAICYDPVNQEVLGGQGRWAYSTRTGRWRRLTFKNALLDPLRQKAEALRLRTKDLAGRCRSRYYHSETPEEAKAKLSELAADIGKDINAQLELFALDKKLPPLSVFQARRKARSAISAINQAAALLAKGITAEAIHKVEDTRDDLELAALALAVQPPRRAFSMMAYDAANRTIVMFGGDRLDRRLADTWVYHCRARTWSQVFPKVSPSPRAGHALLWLPKAKTVLLVDGYGGGAQCWTYDVAKNEWALLAEPVKRSFSFTPTPRYSYMPGAVAVNDEDQVVLTHRSEVFRRRPSKNGTWAAKIDTTKLDAADTQKLGVPPLTMTTPGRYLNPRWYESSVKDPPDPSAGKRLDTISANTWVRLEPLGNPKINRAWGTTVLDPERAQLLQYGGGHAAYCGTDVLHYSIRTNRCSTGSYFPDFTLNWNGSMLGPPIPTSYNGRPHAKHGYRHYGFDPAGGKMIWYSSPDKRFHVYDPSTRDWKGPFGPPVGRGFSGSHNFIFCNTPQGLTIWASPSMIWRLDSQAMKWNKLPVKGKLAGMRVDSHSMACDTKRNRLVFFYLYGKSPEVSAYDLKTGAITKLNAASPTPIRGLCREAMYVPNADLVFLGKPVKLSDGVTYWLCWDCSNDAWVALKLAGPAPRIGVSTGIMYDAKRKLVWTADAALRISVVRLDRKTVTIKELKDESKGTK